VPLLASKAVSDITQQTKNGGGGGLLELGWFPQELLCSIRHFGHCFVLPETGHMFQTMQPCSCKYM
jgi:hypothetical protein